MALIWTLVAILVILWLFGFLFHLAGSLIHILLVVAIIVLLIRIIQGRKPL
ncbi:MAG: lmo0937 family membrane protein [Candidatus Methanoperedens sp.]|nr:lmo0937 family membrane protein [Candidatus Methanoperedens sp.]